MSCTFCKTWPDSPDPAPSDRAASPVGAAGSDISAASSFAAATASASSSSSAAAAAAAATAAASLGGVDSGRMPCCGGASAAGAADGSCSSAAAGESHPPAVASARAASANSASVFEYIFNNVVDNMHSVFLAHNLPRPVAWGDITEKHLDVMASLMADLHSGLEAAIVKREQLTLKPSIWNLFQRGERLDDSCVDYMLAWLVRAVGSRMYGKPWTEEEEHCPGDTEAGASLRTDNADKWYVFGVLHAEMIRGVVTAKKRDAKTVLKSHAESSFPGIESCWSGESELPDEAVRRIVGGIRGIVGTDASVDEAMLHRLNPFEGRDILVCASFGGHTSVFKLEGRPVGSKGGEFRRWTVSTYDSCSYRKWDNRLRKGMACLLEGTGLKVVSENFQYIEGVSLIQDDFISCGPMSFINMARILTGESLEQEHSVSCVHVIRNFFDFKHFRDAENMGVIRRGYLADTLGKDAEDAELVRVLSSSARHAGAAAQPPLSPEVVFCENATDADHPRTGTDEAEKIVLSQHSAVSHKSSARAEAAESADNVTPMQKRSRSFVRVAVEREPQPTMVENLERLKKEYSCVQFSTVQDLLNLVVDGGLVVSNTTSTENKQILKRMKHQLIGINMGDSLSHLCLRTWNLRWKHHGLPGSTSDTQPDSSIRSGYSGKPVCASTSVCKIIKYIADFVGASFLLNSDSSSCDTVAQFRTDFRTWVLDTFRPACIRLLPHDLYYGNHWSCGGRNPLEDAINNFYEESHETDDAKTVAAAPSSTIDKCDKCYESFTGIRTALVCSCGTKRCRICFGAESRSRDLNRVFVCEWCLESWRKNNPEKDDDLLFPDLHVKLCALCGCDLKSPQWAACPARCKHCYRLFCERDAAVCIIDGKGKAARSTAQKCILKLRKRSNSSSADKDSEKPLESFRHVALISCLFCVGRKEYLKNRSEAFKRAARNVFLELRDPLDIPAVVDFIFKRSEVQRHSTEAHIVGDFVFDLHCAGFREISNIALVFLIKMLKVQASCSPEQTILKPSFGAFNLLRLLNQHSHADGRLLETVCVAHANLAEKKGREMLQAIGAGLRPVKVLDELAGNGTPMRRRLGFYGDNLFKAGPLADLVAEAITMVAKRHRDFEVFVFGVGSDYIVREGSDIHPSVKELWEHFDEGHRTCFDEWTSGDADKAKEMLRKLRETQLDVLISLPGWTGLEEWAAVLNCRVAPLQFNWLEFAGVMHAPNLVDFTLLGKAVGLYQEESKNRERIAVFDAPGSYHPPQSRALAAAVRTMMETQGPKDRAYWGIPAESFVLLVPGSTDRLDEENIHLYFELCQRLPELTLMFPDRPAPMRSFILEKLEEFNQDKLDKDTDSKVDRSRLIFFTWMHDKRDFWALMHAVGHEGGGGACICSLGVYTFHTGTGDAFMCRVALFTWRDPNGSMQQRVSAEIATAAGLAWPCVSESPRDTVEAVFKYARDPAQRQRVLDHMQEAQEQEVGFYDPCRVPSGLVYAVKAAIVQLIAAGGDKSKLLDFEIPYTGSKIDPLRPDPPVTGSVGRNQQLWQLLANSELTVELQSCVVKALEGIEEETGARVEEFVGAGVSVFALRISFPDRILGVIKIMKTGCKPDRVHNRTLYREARNMENWFDKLNRNELCSLLPKPIKCLKNKSSFFGHTLPNDDGDIVPFLVCEYIPRSFWDVASVHQRNWQENGVFHDSLRVELLQPMCRGLYWAQRNPWLALVVRDFKPDNLRFRADGSLAIVDTGSGATFPTHCRTKQQAQLVERRCTSMYPTLAKSGSGFLRGQKPRPGEKFVAILPAAMKEFELRLGDRGLAVVGGTTRGFRNEVLRAGAAAGNLRRLLLSVRQFDMNVGSKQDTYAMLRTALYVLTHKEGLSIEDWDALATAAANKGTSGIEKMLLDAAPPRKAIAQQLVFQWMVDFLAGGLGCGHELDIARALTHEINTLEMLTPDQEKCLRSPEGIPFPHGPVHTAIQIPEGFLDWLSEQNRERVEGAMIPKLSLALQPGMGPGARADENISGNVFLGFYVGVCVPNHNCGDVCDVTQFPSRFKVTGQGNIKILKNFSLGDKFTCDTQPTLARNFEYWKDLGSSGPSMNAVANPKSANCTVDRKNAWLDEKTNLIWIPVWSKPAGVKKGEFCMWHYNYLAGAGRLWRFWPEPWAQRKSPS